MNKAIVIAGLMLASFTASAGNNNGPDYGDVTTNNNQTYNNPSATGGTAIANGGNAAATGGAGGDASIGDIRNTNTANGGSVLGSGNSSNNNTALGGVGFGGSANQGQAQGQQQGQGQSQSSVNGQAQGQSSATSTDTSTSTSTAQSQSANNAGNSQQVGGQSVAFSSTYVAKRNAPAAVAPNVYPTATCQKSVSLGLSWLTGGAGGGMSYADKECQTTVLAQNFAAIGMTDTACDVLTTSDAWARAVAAKPELAQVSCRIAKDAAKVLAEPQALAPVIEFPASDRAPRG